MDHAQFAKIAEQQLDARRRKNMLPVTQLQQFTKALDSGKTLVVDFWTDWCHSCKNLEPIMDKLSGVFGTKAEFLKVNADEYPDLTQEYGISAYPTVLVFKNGEIVEQIVGAYPENALKELIQQHV